MSDETGHVPHLSRLHSKHGTGKGREMNIKGEEEETGTGPEEDRSLCYAQEWRG